MAARRASKRDSVSLVVALCHEIGNELAAARLCAHLITRSRDPAERAQGAAAIEGVAVRADALLTQIRPLLVGGQDRISAVSPASVLELVEDEVQRIAPRTRRLEIAVPRRGRDVKADPGTLCGLLLGLVLQACQAVGVRGKVRLASRASGEHVRFVLDERGAGPASPEPGASSPNRDLWFGVAQALLHPMGGRVQARERARGGYTTELSLPCAPPPARRALQAAARVRG